MTVREVYELQQRLSDARWAASREYDRVYYETPIERRDIALISNHPDVVAAQATVDRLTAEVSAARAEVGGKVYRVANAKLGNLQVRIERLNKRAAKLNTDPIELRVTDETDQVVRKAIPAGVTQEEIDIYGADYWADEIIDYTFVVVNGSAPMVPGYVFTAVLDHTADQGADAGVGIRRVPPSNFLRSRVGDAVVDTIEALNLDAWRHAENRCDHCGFKRNRNQTYLLYKIDTDEFKQVGSDCLRDYTGANDPEKVAAWAEYLAALNTDLGFGEEFDVGGGGGRVAIPTLTYLANVAAVMGERGWVPRWRHDDYGYERNSDATADGAMSNLFERNKKYRIEVTEGHHAEAQEALDWIRTDLAERDELDEFQHNLVTYTRGDYLPEKGDGFVAYTIQALRRERERAIEKVEREKVEATRVPVVTGRGEVTGKVLRTDLKENAYGVREVMTVLDDRGFKVWGTVPSSIACGDELTGQRVTFKATIEKSDRDEFFGFFKRPTGARVIE